MPVDITASGADEVVLNQVATDGGYPVTHQGSTRNRIEQVAADAGAGQVPAFSDRNAIEWLAAKLGVIAVYPLDADQAEIQASGQEGRLSMSSDEQAGSYVTVADGVAHNLFATPAGMMDQTAKRLDLSVGKTAVEMQIPAMPSIAGGVGRVGGGIGIYQFDLSDSLTVYCDRQADNTVSIQVGGSTVVSGLSGAPASIGIVKDADSGSGYIRIDGVNYGASAVAVVDAVATMNGYETADLDAADAGKTLTIRLETEAHKFIGNYESGTTDPWGNEVAP